MTFNLILVGCSNIKRPNTDLLNIDAEFLELYGYNLKRDYEVKEDGSVVLKKGAKPIVKQFKSAEEMLKAMDKGWFTDNQVGFPELKAYVKKVRKYCK